MVSVQVDNQNSFAVEIFAYRNRNRTKLGLVGPGLVRILQFEWRADDVRFIIDFVGSDNQRLPEIDRRDTFAADAMDSVPCILTDVNPIEAGVTLTLVIPEGLEQTQGRSRCAR